MCCSFVRLELWLLLILCFFGPMFAYIEPVPILVLFTPSFSLLFQFLLDRDTKMTTVCRIAYYLALLIFMCAGFWLGAVDFLGVSPTVLMAFVFNLLTIIINALWLRVVRFCETIADSLVNTTFVVLSLPTMFAAIYCLISYSAVATLYNVSINLRHFDCLAQIASLFGVHALTFCHYWFTSLLCLYLYSVLADDAADFRIVRAQSFRLNVLKFLGAMLFVELYGGFRLNVKHFWHTDAHLWPDNDVSVRAMCVTRKTNISGPNFLTQPQDIELLLTAETYTLRNETNYAKLLNYSQKVSDAYNHSMIAAIGIGNFEEGGAENSLEVWVMRPKVSATKLFTYLKGNPVPTMENFPPRQMKPPIVDLSEYGFNFSISALICFDMAYPDWAIHAADADLVLHPSFLWNSFMDFFLDTISFRSIENGFAQFHCAETGNTAAINTYGEVDFKHANNLNTSRLTITEASSTRSLWTFWAAIGYVYDYFVMIFGLAYIVFALVVCVFAQRVRECLRRCGVRQADYTNCSDVELVGAGDE